MNYIQRKLIAVLASLVFSAVYFSLKGFAFRLDLAVCASYTVMVLAKVKRKRGKAGLLAGEDAIPAVELFLGHILALVLVAAVVRLGIYAAPVLPGWLTTPIGSVPGGRPLPTPLRYLQTGMVFLVGFTEYWWLTSIKTSEEKEAQRRVIHGKDAYEQHLTSRLRLDQNRADEAARRPVRGWTVK
jgi:hypothetical protein